jgi:hypothetical protein
MFMTKNLSFISIASSQHTITGIDPSGLFFKSQYDRQVKPVENRFQTPITGAKAGIFLGHLTNRRLTYGVIQDERPRRHIPTTSGHNVPVDIEITIRQDNPDNAENYQHEGQAKYSFSRHPYLQSHFINGAAVESSIQRRHPARHP